MRRSVFAAVAGLVAIVLLGFVPNAWTWAPFPFTVPDDAKATSFRGLPPGKYRATTGYWYWMQFGVTLDHSGRVVEITRESHR